MFGPTIDYHLLRPLCHSRARLTAGERAAARPATNLQLLPTFLAYFDGKLDVRGKTVLDVGCGVGTMAIEAVRQGAARAVGLDVNPAWISLARERVEADAELGGRVHFVCADVRAWEPPERFEVVVSRTALEHVDDPEPFLRRVVELVAPGGVFAAIWEPFHGPFGDHLRTFFRVQVPWRGLLFNEQALLRLRREFFRPDERAEHWGELAIGMNLLRYSAFARICRETGLEIIDLRPNARPLSRRWLRPLVGMANLLGRIPRVRDYVAAAPIVLLRRPAAPGA